MLSLRSTKKGYFEKQKIHNYCSIPFRIVFDVYGSNTLHILSDVMFGHRYADEDSSAPNI